MCHRGLFRSGGSFTRSPMYSCSRFGRGCYGITPRTRKTKLIRLLGLFFFQSGKGSLRLSTKRYARLFSHDPTPIHGVHWNPSFVLCPFCARAKVEDEERGLLAFGGRAFEIASVGSP